MDSLQQTMFCGTVFSTPCFGLCCFSVWSRQRSWRKSCKKLGQRKTRSNDSEWSANILLSFCSGPFLSFSSFPLHYCSSSFSPSFCFFLLFFPNSLSPSCLTLSPSFAVLFWVQLLCLLVHSHFESSYACPSFSSSPFFYPCLSVSLSYSSSLSLHPPPTTLTCLLVVMWRGGGAHKNIIIPPCFFQHTQIVETMFTMFFNVLKREEKSPLLPVVLEALAKWVHTQFIEHHSEA